MFLCTIFIWPCDLDLRPFDFGGVWRIKKLIRPTHLPILSFLRLSVHELCVTQSDHIYHLERSLRMRHVTWPITGVKNDPHFWNPWTQFTYSLCHFYGATTNFKPCYKRKIAFSHCKGYRVNCACAVSRDLCTGDPPKPHVAIFDPELSVHYTTFMGLRWRLRVVLYESIPMLKRFLAAKKAFLSPVKIGPRNGGFSEI